jgi:hypothetical protein
MSAMVVMVAMAAIASCTVTGSGFTVVAGEDGGTVAAASPPVAPSIDAGAGPPEVAAVPDADRVAPPGPDAPRPPTVADAAVVLADAPPAPALPLRIMRVHDVMADQITAGVVFAHKLEAKGGTVGLSGDPLSDEALAAQMGPDDLKIVEIVVDVLYAHHIRAKSVQLRQVHVSMMKLGDK